MSIIRRPAPFNELLRMREAFDRLFDERPFRPHWLSSGERDVTPPLDVYRTPETVIARAALPGVKPEDGEIKIADELVTITDTFTEEQESAEAGYTHWELSRGAFRRSFTAPAALKADEAKAAFKDGLLTLTIPRAEESSHGTSRSSHPDGAGRRQRSPAPPRAPARRVTGEALAPLLSLLDESAAPIASRSEPGDDH